MEEFHEERKRLIDADAKAKKWIRRAKQATCKAAWQMAVSLYAQDRCQRVHLTAEESAQWVHIECDESFKVGRLEWCRKRQQQAAEQFNVARGYIIEGDEYG